MHPTLQRLVETYRRPIQRAATGAAWTALVVTLVGAALLARGGTLLDRALAGGLVLLALVVLVSHRWLTNRRYATEDKAITAAIGAVDREQGARLLRALRLARDTEHHAMGQSPELAQLHYQRVLSKVNAGRMQGAAKSRARFWKQLTLVGLCSAAFLVVFAPWHLVEGVVVMSASEGKSRVGLNLLELPTVRATPPAYLRQKKATLTLDSAVALPAGTELSFNGVPIRTGRELVLTDGTTEVPFADDGSGAVVAHWELDKSVRLSVAARFGDVLVYEPRSIEVYSQPDEPPVVRLEGAPAEHKLEEMTSLELLWQAHDDHGLTQVDLVLRSAGREDRRTLENFPGDMRSGRGGHVLGADDAFLRRVFLPVDVRIEARDNDPSEGAKWGQSEVIRIRPPGVGSPQVARYQALEGLLDQLVKTLATQLDLEAEKDVELQATLRERRSSEVSELEALAGRVLSDKYTGLTVPRGWSAFFEGQLQRLHKAFKSRREERETLESIVLGMNSALGKLARDDAQDVSRQLADVAEEAALAARAAQQLEDRQEGRLRLQVAIDVLDSGAKELQVLGTLGADLGSVALADLLRVRRSFDNADHFHAELAALHMAERLRRPNPSFGSKGGGGGGVESGGGTGGGKSSDATGQPKESDSDFDKAAGEVDRLAREHAELTERTGSAMDQAESSSAADDSLQQEAKERAEAVRRGAMRLPQPGESPGTGRAAAALSREHAGAMAHELERANFQGAAESGRRAQAAAEEALRHSDLDPVTRARLQALLEELREQIRWADEQAKKMQREAEQAASEALSEFSKLEEELAKRAENLSQGDLSKMLPSELRGRLEQAGRLMENAAEQLRGGRGNDAQRLQAEAQRLLEQSDTGDMHEGDEGEESSPDGKGEGGRNIRTGGDVPNPDDKNAAEDFRRRVLEGLSEQADGRLSPAVKRYAEGLLR